MFGFTKFNPTTDLDDLSGKVIIVTGANQGIGYGTAKHLSRKGAKVYVGSRSEEKGRKAITQLQEEGTGSGEVIWFLCDLSNPALAKASAEGFLRQETRLDVLVNNAACVWDSDEPAQDGITEMMMVNHIGTFLFTRVLLPLLLKTSEEPGSDVRIVIVSSNGHRSSKAANPNANFTMESFKDHHKKELSPFFARYCVSKLANILFSSALQRRITASSIICVALHPGFVNTSVAGRLSFPRLANFVMSLISKTPDEGAYNSCYAAASPLVRQQAEKYKGAYLEPVGKLVLPAPNAQKVELQEQLWKTTDVYLESRQL